MSSMSGYTKLFQSILASTIWRADDKVRIVWITMLAMADKDGRVDGSIPGLADMARVSVEDAEKALDELKAPDAYSRTKEHAGRRIEEVDGGWFILNHAKYREKMNEDQRREYNRKKQADFRARQRCVTNSNPLLPMSAQAEADTKADSDSEEDTEEQEREIELTIDTSSFITAETIWKAYPKKVDKKEAMPHIQKALKKMSPPLLLERTRLWAESREGEDDHFTPYPAKWFRAERYNEDPATWKKKPAQRAYAHMQNGPQPDFSVRLGPH